MDLINRRTYTIYFYVCFVLFLVIRYFDGLFLSQISSNPIRSPRVDLIVWLTHLIDLPDLFTNTTLSLILDTSIVILPLIILFQVFRNRSIHKTSLVLSFLFTFYILVIYCYPTLSLRKYLGLVLIPFAFSFSNNERFSNYLRLMRYFVLFVFTSASLWKITRGVIFDDWHMQLSLKLQHIDNFANWPDHYITKLLSTFIANSQYCYVLFILAVLMQLSFVVGFFTRKYDRLLAFFLIVFIITDYLVMRIEYWEYIVFLPLFWYPFPPLKGIKSSKN